MPDVDQNSPPPHKMPKWLWVAIFALILFMIAASTPFARGLAKDVDAHLFGYRFVDTYAWLRGGEDWSQVAPLPAGQSAAWARAPVRIAHAMGSWGLPGENTPAALSAALAAGFTLIEVDLSFGPDGKLHCFHGPGPARLTDWPLEELLRAAAARNFYIVLDLKSDFDRSAREVLRLVQGTGLEQRIIFQLYGPSDIAWFTRNVAGKQFPAPIVTLYRSLRFKPHLVPNLERIGAKVVTVPIERADEFRAVNAFATLLVHPLESCDAARRLQAKGGYMRTNAPCGPEAASADASQIR